MISKTDKTIMHCYPGLVAVVTVKHDETLNMMAAGWHSYMSYDPPIYGVAIAKERHTYKLVKDSQSFVINFVPAESAHLIEGAGKSSGRDGDKFSSLQVRWTPGEKTGSPVLDEAYVAYECSVSGMHEYGDHDWIAGDIVTFYQDSDRFEKDTGFPDFHKLQLPLYLGRSQYLIQDKATTRKIVDLE